MSHVPSFNNFSRVPTQSNKLIKIKIKRIGTDQKPENPVLCVMR